MTRYTVGMPPCDWQRWRYVIDAAGDRVGWAIPDGDPVAERWDAVAIDGPTLGIGFPSPDAVAAAWSTMARAPAGPPTG